MGAMHRLGETKPDMAILAKGMANGYPLAAILGIGSIMDAAQKTFISAQIGRRLPVLAAAMATINIKKLTLQQKINLMGSMLKSVWEKRSQNMVWIAVFQE